MPTTLPLAPIPPDFNYWPFRFNVRFCHFYLLTISQLWSYRLGFLTKIQFLDFLNYLSADSTKFRFFSGPQRFGTIFVLVFISLSNYTNSLVNMDSFYTYFTNTTFQKIPIPYLTRAMTQKVLY